MKKIEELEKKIKQMIWLYEEGGFHYANLESLKECLKLIEEIKIEKN